MMSDTLRDKHFCLKIFILRNAFLKFILWYHNMVSFWAFKNPVVLVCLLLPLLWLFSFLQSSCKILHDALFIRQESFGYCHTIFNPFSCLAVSSHGTPLEGKRKQNLNSSHQFTRQFPCLNIYFLFFQDSQQRLLEGGQLTWPHHFRPSVTTWGGGTQPFLGLLTLPAS